MNRIEDPEIQEIVRYAVIERIAELLYVRFLVDMKDGRKAADVILDMLLRETGRGNGSAALLKTPEA
jgi:hypothetical protein